MDRLDPVGGRGPLVCPKTGKPIQSPSMLRWAKWLFPFAGLISLIWFLVRVLPKPSRASYPCQRVAAPMASSFVIWLMGIGGCALAFRNARQKLKTAQFVLSGLLLVVGVLASLVAVVGGPGRFAHANSNIPYSYQPSWVRTDPVNTPMGVARGIHPGRVAWVQDFNSTSGDIAWDNTIDGSNPSGYFWDENHCHQAVVNDMVGKAVRWMTGETTEAAAWDAIFRYFNRNHGKGDIGYQPGEKIAIKLNASSAFPATWPGYSSDPERSYMMTNPDDPANAAIYHLFNNESNPTPQMTIALLHQLVDVAGVPQEDIYVGDPIRFWLDPFYNRCHAAYPNVHYMDPLGQTGRERVQLTSQSVLFYSGPASAVTDQMSKFIYDSDYFINLALLKRSGPIGGTFCGKNTFGVMGRSPEHLHDWLHGPDGWATGMGTYHVLVDHMGTKQLGGKTLLYMLDGLFGGWWSNGAWSMPVKWDSLGGKWPSGVFVSQDPVAIDSVGLDVLHSETTDLADCADNYMHEAALANNPPSGTFYDPDKTGVRLPSLGVHEHWNDDVHKQYSRNLGTGNGIELITSQPAVPSVLQIGSASANYGGAGTVTVPITMVAQGTESAVGFSLQYDTNLLSNPVVALGSSDAAGTLNVNTSQTALGKLGIAIAQTVGGGGPMPTFAAGTDQIATVTFTVKSVSDLTFTTVNFTTQPINPEVVDMNANVLDMNLNSGTVMIPYGYEADVTPRPSGKNTGSIAIQNWVQVGRFAAGLDTTTTLGEFQRADCAPRGTCGDGKLTMADWVQAGRYAIGLDPVTRADGPWTTLGSGVARVATAQAAASAYAVRSTVSLQPAVMTSGRTGTVYLLLNGQGIESALGFTLNFDPTLLRFTGARLGSGASGAQMNVNTLKAANGAVGIGLAFPLTRTLTKGKKMLLELSFVPTSARTVSTKLSFSDQVVARELVDANATDIPVNFTGGSVMILGKR